MVGGEELPEPPLEAALTVMVKEASETDVVPSVTEITMPGKLPTLPDPGVPESLPVLVLKVAQLGLFWMEKVSVPPLGSVVVGVKLYAVPAVAVVAGVPLIVGAAAAVTVIEKAASEALEEPSLTEITMPE